MADSDKTLSLMGAAPPSSHSIDDFHWDEAALNFAEFTVADYETLVSKLGTDCASEVLLISVTKKCGSDILKWNEARKLGIPLQSMRWTHLGGLMENYDARITQTKGADSTPQVMRRPASYAQTSSKKGRSKNVQKNLKSQRTAWTGNEQHFDRKSFDDHQLEFKTMEQSAF